MFEFLAGYRHYLVSAALALIAVFSYVDPTVSEMISKYLASAGIPLSGPAILAVCAALIVALKKITG